MILGIANYCYDWAVAYDKDGNLKWHTAASKKRWGRVWPGLRKLTRDLEMDDLNPRFYYSDSGNVDHVVYMLDAVTAYNQIMALKGYEPKGVALWRLGSEDPTIWSFLDDDTLGRPLANVKQLSNVDLKFQVDLDNSQGELMQVSQTGTTGHRDLDLDQDGLIISEAYKPYPSPYVVSGVGFCRESWPSLSMTAQTRSTLARFWIFSRTRKCPPHSLSSAESRRIPRPGSP